MLTASTRAPASAARTGAWCGESADSLSATEHEGVYCGEQSAGGLPCPPIGSTENLSGSSVGSSWTCPVKPLDRRGLVGMEARGEDSSPIHVLPPKDRRIGGNDRSWCRARAVRRATTSCGHTVKSVAYCASMDPEHSRSSLAVLQRPRWWATAAHPSPSRVEGGPCSVRFPAADLIRSRPCA